MFGYVKPYVPDLRVRENEMYRALYCGLCRSMGKHTTPLSRMTLSYDFVFLASVRCVLEGCEVKAVPKRCAVHPFRKRPSVCDNSALAYSAACAAVLAKAKLEDDIQDSAGLHRFFSRLALIPAKRMEKKAVASADVPRDAVYDCLSRLSALEKANCTSLDSVADIFGELLSAVFSHGLSGSECRIAAALGRSIGKYIYVIDAADDAADDKKAGSYNTLNLSPISKEALSAAIRLELCDAAAAAELLESPKYPELCEIIKNIVYEGLPKNADKIFEKTDNNINKQE